MKRIWLSKFLFILFLDKSRTIFGFNCLWLLLLFLLFYCYFVSNWKCVVPKSQLYLIYLFIYLFLYYQANTFSRHCGVAKPLTPTPVTDALIGGEEQSVKKRRENKERNEEWAFDSAILDPSVASYDPQGSYGEPILLPLPPWPTSMYNLCLCLCARVRKYIYLYTHINQNK